MIALGCKYDLSCLAVLVNCARQHTNGKVIRKKRKTQLPISYYSRVNFLELDSRVLPFSSSQTGERSFAKGVAADK